MSYNPDAPPKNALTRRLLVSTAAVVPLAACSSSDVGGGSYSFSYSELVDALAISSGLKAPPTITREQAAAIPYSSIGYKIGDSAEGMLVLGSATGTSLLWTASSRVVLVTIGGRITKTAGLPWNLSDTNFRDFDPVTDFSRSLPSAPISRMLDFSDLSRFAVVVSSTFSSAQPETIKILGQDLSTLVFVEDCDCPDFDWKFQNRYWADAQSGFVWRSRQYTHPRLDPLEIEIFRPPA